MMKKTILVLAFAACGLAAVLPFHRIPHSGPYRKFGLKHGRIVGGQDATLGQFPYQVSLRWLLQGVATHICSGSVISSTVVVTAGHCVHYEPLGYYQAAAGDNDLSVYEGTEQISNVYEQIQHPNYFIYNGLPTNDAAVMLLYTPLTLNSNVQAVALPVTDSIPPDGSIATLSGWGSVNTSGIPESTDVLQWVDVPVIGYDECALLVGDRPLSKTAHLCTGPVTGGVAACWGDSGGPLVQDGVIVGIVTWGYIPCGPEGAPSVFSRVSAFNDFIYKYI